MIFYNNFNYYIALLKEKKYICIVRNICKIIMNNLFLNLNLKYKLYLKY